MHVGGACAGPLRFESTGCCCGWAESGFIEFLMFFDFPCPGAVVVCAS